MFLGEVKIGNILHCLADSSKIRFGAYLDKDVSEVMPYMNTLLKNGIYNHIGRTLTIRKEGRLITLHSNKIAAGKVLGEKDAVEIIEWLRELINYCHENKDKIEPNYDRRHKLTALDIYKLLPATNCKECGELTCLAFAMKLSNEEVDVMKCKTLFYGEYTEKRNILLQLLSDSGYEVSSVFINAPGGV